MTTSEHESDAVVRSIADLKRQLTELKLEALRRSGRGAPSSDIHDIDAIVEEVVSAMQERPTEPSASDNRIPMRSVPRTSANQC